MIPLVSQTAGIDWNHRRLSGAILLAARKVSSQPFENDYIWNPNKQSDAMNIYRAKNPVNIIIDEAAENDPNIIIEEPVEILHENISKMINSVHSKRHNKKSYVIFHHFLTHFLSFEYHFYIIFISFIT